MTNCNLSVVAIADEGRRVKYTSYSSVIPCALRASRNVGLCLNDDCEATVWCPAVTGRTSSATLMHEARVKSGERSSERAARGRSWPWWTRQAGRICWTWRVRPASQPRLYLRDHRLLGTRRCRASIIILRRKSTGIASSGFILRRISFWRQCIHSVRSARSSLPQQPSHD